MLEIPTMALLNNYDGTVWRIHEMAQMLANPTSRANLSRDAVQFAIEAHQAGIVVDFEEVPEKSQPDFRAFIGELAPALHAVGLKDHDRPAARDERVRLQILRKRVRRHHADELRPALAHVGSRPHRRARLVRGKFAAGDGSRARFEDCRGDTPTMLTTGPKRRKSAENHLSQRRNSACRKRCCTPMNRKRKWSSTLSH